MIPMQGPLERLLCRLMWRTAKKDVLRQIEIPAQSYTSHWLSFSPVEEHFYRTQHIECTRDQFYKMGLPGKSILGDYF